MAAPDPLAPPFTEAQALGFDASAFESRLRRLDLRAPHRFARERIPSDFRRSSVLLCFWREASDVHVLLTARAASLREHPGQMSFPGGSLEAGEDWVAGALRETEEEVGIPRDTIEVLGRLDDAWSGSGHHLVPIVGWLESRPEFVLNPAEVDRAHTPSVRTLLSPEAHQSEAATFDATAYVNTTLRWREGDEIYSVFGLTTNLLVEALEWGIGLEVARGAERLETLDAWLRWKAREAQR